MLLLVLLLVLLVLLQVLLLVLLQVLLLVLRLVLLLVLVLTSLLQLGGASGLVNVCLLPNSLLFKQELWRLLSSYAFHASDAQLMWSVLTLLHKGSALEPRLGTQRFCAVLFGLGMLTGGFVVAASVAARRLSGSRDWANACYLGASPLAAALVPLLARKPPPPPPRGPTHAEVTMLVLLLLLLLLAAALADAFVHRVGGGDGGGGRGAGPLRVHRGAAG